MIQKLFHVQRIYDAYFEWISEPSAIVASIVCLFQGLLDNSAS